jgi:hypothetical protein
MANGITWTYSIAAITEHNAVMRVLYKGYSFSLFLLKSVDAMLAIFQAFSTRDAFYIVDNWIPRYLISGDAVKCFFHHLNYLCQSKALVISNNTKN